MKFEISPQRAEIIIDEVLVIIIWGSEQGFIQIRMLFRQFVEFFHREHRYGCAPYFVAAAVLHSREIYLHAVLGRQRNKQVWRFRRFRGRHAEALYFSHRRFHAPWRHRRYLVIVIVGKALLHPLSEAGLFNAVADQGPFKLCFVYRLVECRHFAAINAIILHLRVIGFFPVEYDMAALGKLPTQAQVYCRLGIPLILFLGFKADKEQRKLAGRFIEPAQHKLVPGDRLVGDELPSAHIHQFAVGHLLHFLQ